MPGRRAVVALGRASAMYAPPSTLTWRSNRLSPSLELARLQRTVAGTPVVGIVVASIRTVGAVIVGAVPLLGGGVAPPPLGGVGVGVGAGAGAGAGGGVGVGLGAGTRGAPP